ncbi:vascular cell adhesion protein 1-like isoform X2 [Siniperca chuatsi]|uniref:vascular cell adhesion protein 1-like isoform X2 n=1 Tax=Siniperca chuatsi TaxID=119488 RepID=UPI001CE0719B|nr:vascular cell adhesion protein 1-like isoform X2 [Siniperca chuatsi]
MGYMAVLSVNTATCNTLLHVLFLSGALAVCPQKANLFITAPQKMEALSGSCLQIPCNFRAEPEKKFDGIRNFAVWIKQSDNLYPSDVNFESTYPMNITGNLSHNSCTTLVSSLNPNYADTFYFRIQNSAFRATAVCDPLQINVTDSPPSPRIEISGDLKEKESVTITCSALTPCPHSPPKLTWSLQQDSHSYTEENTNGTFTTKIQATITLSDQHDGDNITCSARYPVNEGKDVKTAEERKTLSVSYAPKDTSGSISPSGLVSAGSWVNLTCSSRAKPPVSRFTWFKKSTDGSMTVSEGQVYSFNATDGGVCYCVATNDLGNQTSSEIHLTIKGKDSPPSPRIEISGDLKEKESVTITCSAFTPCPHSPPKLTWSLQQDSHSYTEENTDGTFTTKIQATITLSDQHDGDNITCSARYPVNEGEDVKTAEERKTLSVSYAPKDTSGSISPSGLVSAGSWVNLTCSSRAKPPVSCFTWFKKSTDGPMTVSEGQVYSFNATDGGVYYCVATNDLGNQTSSQIHLNNADNPEFGVVVYVTVKILGIVVLYSTIVIFEWWFGSRCYNKPVKDAVEADGVNRGMMSCSP